MNLKELREKLEAHKEKTSEFYSELEAIVEADNDEEPTAEQRQKLDRMIDEGKNLRRQLEAKEELERQDKLLNEPEREPRAKRGAASGDEDKTWGQIVVASDEFKAAREDRAERMDRVNVKAIYGSTDTAGGHFVVVQRDPELVGAAGLEQQPTSIIDLVNTMETESDSIEYVRITTRTNAADVVPEYTGGNFGLKPESNLVFDLQSTPVKTIATWIAASRRILQDAPQLRGLVDGELTYMLRIDLEDQILNGDGTGNNFTGILSASGIQTRTQGATGDRGGEAGDTKADALRRAITDIRLEFFEATGVVLNPGDGEDLELAKDANGQYLNIYDSVTGRIWRVDVAETPLIAAGTGLVGNFVLGATLYDRMQTEIRVGEPNDFFIRNAVAILAELRAAFAVKRPHAFESVTFV